MIERQVQLNGQDPRVEALAKWLHNRDARHDVENWTDVESLWWTYHWTDVEENRRRFYRGEAIEALDFVSTAS